MAIIKVRDENGDVIDIPAFVGPKGDPGADYVLTEADKAEIAAQAAEMVDVPEGGAVTDEQVENAVDKYLSEHPAQGNVYFNKLTKSYTVTEDDVYNYTPGDEFVISIDGLKGYPRIFGLRMGHASTGGSVISECTVVCADTNNKFNHYRSSTSIISNCSMGAWNDRTLTCIISEIGGCAQIQGVTSFVGNGVSAVSAMCRYWVDSNIYPLTSICFRFKFSTLAAGLGIDIQVLEEAAI